MGYIALRWVSGLLAVGALTHAAIAQPPRDLRCAASYQGNHDSSSCQLVDGWAWDTTQPNTPISVDVLVDGALFRTQLADVFRQDLVMAGVGNGTHGFRFIVPVSLRNGVAHSMRVRVAGTTFDLSGTPQTINCAVPSGGFYTVAPCRVVDTRNPTGPLGGPSLSAGVTRLFPLGGTCGVPSTAEAISLNITVVTATADGALHVFSEGLSAVPTATALSYSANLARANNGVIAPGAGNLGVYSDQLSGTVDIVIDVNGYFQ